MKFCIFGCAGLLLHGRSPCGERGLKCGVDRFFRGLSPSLPVRGAWVEMVLSPRKSGWTLVAPRAGSVG